jgi:GNAT superfamily N-acetyltransferase
MNDMIPPVLIRVATREDLPAVLDLYQQAGLDRDGGMTPGEAGSVYSRFEIYPCYKLYVACYGDRVVGTFALLIMDNLAHHGRPSGIVEDVAVDPLTQGRGVGKAMMRFAREICRGKGCYKLSLTSNQERKDAHAFYEAIGFERHGYSFRVTP